MRTRAKLNFSAALFDNARGHTHGRIGCGESRSRDTLVGTLKVCIAGWALSGLVADEACAAAWLNVFTCLRLFLITWVRIFPWSSRISNLTIFDRDEMGLIPNGKYRDTTLEMNDIAGFRHLFRASFALYFFSYLFWIPSGHKCTYSWYMWDYECRYMSTCTSTRLSEVLNRSQ